MRILLTGGTGLIGRALIKRWHLQHDVTVLTRDIGKAATLLANVRLVHSLDEVDFNSIDAVVNLAGEPIAEKRWTTIQKDRI